MLRVLSGVVLVGLGTFITLQLLGLSVLAVALWPVVLIVIGCGIVLSVGSRSIRHSFGRVKRRRRLRAGHGTDGYFDMGATMGDPLHGGEHWVLHRHHDVIQRVK